MKHTAVSLTVLIAVIFSALLLLLEGVARLTVGSPATQSLTVESHDVETDFDVTYALKPDHTRWTCAPTAPVTRRIAVIGDSFVFGQGVTDRENFVARLSCEMPGTDVINLGVTGADFEEYELALRELVPHDVTDIVLLVYDNDLPPLPVQLSPRRRLQRVLVPRSSFLTLLRTARRHIAERRYRAIADSFRINGRFNNPTAVILGDSTYFRDIAHPSEARLALLDTLFHRFLAIVPVVAPHARVFVASAQEVTTLSASHRRLYESIGPVTLPEFGRPAALTERIRRNCEAAPGCRYIDLFPLLAEHPDTYYFPHDMHWSAPGHRMVSTELERILADTTRR